MHILTSFAYPNGFIFRLPVSFCILVIIENIIFIISIVINSTNIYLTKLLCNFLPLIIIMWWRCRWPCWSSYLIRLLLNSLNYDECLICRAGRKQSQSPYSSFFSVFVIFLDCLFVKSIFLKINIYHYAVYYLIC